MDAALRAAAEAAPGFMPPDEGLALYDAAVAAAADGPLLEVGSWMGKSTLYLAAAARERKTQVVTVDHHRGSEEHQPGWEYHDALARRPRAWVESTRCRTSGVRRRPPASRTSSSPSSRRPRCSPRCGRRRSRSCSSTAATPTSRRNATSPCWAPHLAPGGTLAIHDVFPDPADGGQAPYRMYLTAIETGAYDELPGTGSLRLLKRR